MSVSSNSSASSSFNSDTFTEIPLQNSEELRVAPNLQHRQVRQCKCSIHYTFVFICLGFTSVSAPLLKFGTKLPDFRLEILAYVSLYTATIALIIYTIGTKRLVEPNRQ